MQKSRAQIWTQLTEITFFDGALMKRRSLRKQFLNENHTSTTLGCYLWNWYFLRFPKVLTGNLPFVVQDLCWRWKFETRFPKVLTGNLPFVVQDLCILQRFSKRFPKSSKVPQKVPRELFPGFSGIFRIVILFWKTENKTKTETL